MGYRDRLSNAKFKGVEMNVEAVASTKGRRVPVRRLVGQDESVQQDLGREPDEYEITAYYWGWSFDQQRDTLEAALVEEGAGSLTLPTRGELQARVTSGPFTSEHKDEGGYCTIRFSVVVEPRKGAGASKAAAGGLKATTDTSAKLKTSAQSTQATAAATAEKGVNIAGMPSQAVKSTTKAVQAGASALKSVQQVIQANTNTIDDLSAAIADVDQTANTILSTPSALATKVTAVVLGVFGLADTVENNVDRTTGLLIGDSATTPFEKASPARATMSAVSVMSALGATEKTSAGVSVGTGTSAPATVSRVASATTRETAAAYQENLQRTGSITGSASNTNSSTSTISAATPTQAAAAARLALFGPERSALSNADQEELNTRAVYELFRTVSIAAAAQTFATATFDSSTLALAALELLSDAIDELQAYSASDDVVESLSELRGALAAHLTAVASELPATVAFNASGLVTTSDDERKAVQSISVGQSADGLDVTTRKAEQRQKGLPRVVAYKPPREAPAVLIAHEFYSDAELDEDIIARNNTPHPLFVSGLIELVEP